MELLIVAVIAGAVVAVVVAWIIWRAVGNALDWLIHTFGNEEAAERIRRKWNSEPKDGR